MSSAWDEVERLSASSGSGAGKFLRLQDGEQVNVVFLGEPMPIQTVFVDGKSHTFSEKWAKLGKKPSNRVRINVWQVDKNLVSIWESGIGTFKKVLALMKAYGPEKFFGRVFCLGRTGTLLSSEYNVMFLDNLTPEQLAEKERLVLHDLTPIDEDDSAPSAPAPQARPVPEKDPFKNGGHTVEDVKAIARDLPADIVRKVLAAEGFSKIGDIPQADAERVYIRLEAEAVFG